MELSKNQVHLGMPQFYWLVRKIMSAFAVDYPGLTSVTEPTLFPLSNISDVFDTIADAKADIFTVLELKNGFGSFPSTTS